MLSKNVCFLTFLTCFFPAIDAEISPCYNYVKENQKGLIA